MVLQNEDAVPTLAFPIRKSSSTSLESGSVVRSAGLLGILSACALLSLLTAQGEESRVYLRGDLGGSLTCDNEGSVRVDFGTGFGGHSAFRARFDPGERVGVAGGYQITDWFAAEGEVGAMVNEVNGTGYGLNGTFANVPFLLNVKLRYPNHSHWTPYVGAGLGISVAILDADAFVPGTTTATLTRVSTTEADAVFAYQAFAGLRYRLNDRMGLSVEYRHLVIEAPQWDFEDRYIHGAVAFGRVENHAFSLAFDYRF